MRDVSLRLGPGEGLLVARARRAAGKTSLLRGLLGLVPRAARVLGGAPAAPRRGLAGYGPQGEGFAAGLRVDETVRLSRACAGRPSPAAAAEDALGRAGLGFVARWRTRRLDAEGWRRLSLALAIAGDPRRWWCSTTPGCSPTTCARSPPPARAARAVLAASSRPAGPRAGPGGAARPGATGRRDERGARPVPGPVPCASPAGPGCRSSPAAASLAAVVVAAVAASESGAGREDAFRRGGASLLLLGGLVRSRSRSAATALNRDADLGPPRAAGGRGRLAPAGRRRDRARRASPPSRPSSPPGAWRSRSAARRSAWGSTGRWRSTPWRWPSGCC